MFKKSLKYIKIDYSTKNIAAKIIILNKNLQQVLKYEYKC